MTNYRDLNVTAARALLVQRDNNRQNKAILSFMLVLVIGIVGIAIGQGWARNASISWSTFAIALVVVPLGLVWLMAHNFGISRRMEKFAIVLPAATIFVALIVIGVLNAGRVDWEQALWGFGAFVYLTLSAALVGAVCIGTNNIRNNQDT